MSKNKNILVTLVFIVATFINANAEIQNNFSINYLQFHSKIKETSIVSDSENKIKTEYETYRYALAQYNLDYIFNSGFIVGGNIGWVLNLNNDSISGHKDRFLNGTAGLNLGYKINKFVSLIGNANYFLTHSNLHYCVGNIGAKVNLMKHTFATLTLDAGYLLKEGENSFKETDKKISLGFNLGLGLNF